jgi:hypothetical protein
VKRAPVSFSADSAHYTQHRIRALTLAQQDVFFEEQIVVRDDARRIGGADVVYGDPAALDILARLTAGGPLRRLAGLDAEDRDSRDLLEFLKIAPAVASTPIVFSVTGRSGETPTLKSSISVDGSVFSALAQSELLPRSGSGDGADAELVAHGHLEGSARLAPFGA